jgi:hypothetical protein
MITAGDVEFEPPQTKVFPLTSSITAMIAGDASLQTEILYALREQVNSAIQANAKVWLNVKDVADWYYSHYQAARNIRAERTILNPLGLDRMSFISRQGQMQGSLVNRIASELANFSMPEIEAIIAGIDLTGPHIYVADNRGVDPRDSAGFAAIGVGYWHANSQFMFAGHAKWKPMPEVLSLTYAAKRRAEVAPGVGEGTDMFMIGPQLGSSFMIGDHVIAALGKIYEKTRKRSLKSQEQARKEVNRYVDELGKKSEEAAGPPTSQQQPTLPEGTGAIDNTKFEAATEVENRSGQEGEAGNITT